MIRVTKEKAQGGNPELQNPLESESASTALMVSDTKTQRHYPKDKLPAKYQIIKGSPTAFAYAYYHPQTSKLLRLKLRANTTSGKEIKQAFTNERGELVSQAQAWAEGISSLYGWPEFLAFLDDLPSNACAHVAIVEGEKVADAWNDLHQDGKVGPFAITAGGANAFDAQHANLIAAALTDRPHRVTVWPDDDQPGQNAARCVAQLCADAGLDSYRVGTMPRFNGSSGRDVADLIEESTSPSSLDKLAKSALKVEPMTAEAEDGEELPSLPKPPLEVLPRDLRAYCQALAEEKNADPALVFASMLGVVFGATGERDVTRDAGWTEAGIAFLCLVGDPGTGKTPVMDSLTGPLYEYDRRIREESRAEVADWERREAEAKRTKQRFDERRPLERKLVLNDFTQQALEKALQGSPTVFCLADEMRGLFDGLARFTGDGGGAFHNRILSLWSGTSLRSDRRKADESFEVDRPRLTILGATTPSAVIPIFQNRAGDGMTARILCVYVQPREFRQTKPMDGSLRAVWPDFINRLMGVEEAIAQVFQSADKEQATSLSLSLSALSGPRPALTLTEEATRVHDDWRAQNDPYHMGSEAAKELYAKGNGYALRLAKVVALFHDPQAMVIDATVMHDACKVLDWLLANSLYVRRIAAPETTNASDLLTGVSSQARALYQKMYRKSQGTPCSHEEVRALYAHKNRPQNLLALLQELVDAGHLTQITGWNDAKAYDFVPASSGQESGKYAEGNREREPVPAKNPVNKPKGTGNGNSGTSPNQGEHA